MAKITESNLWEIINSIEKIEIPLPDLSQIIPAQLEQAGFDFEYNYSDNSFKIIVADDYFITASIRSTENGNMYRIDMYAENKTIQPFSFAPEALQSMIPRLKRMAEALDALRTEQEKVISKEKQRDVLKTLVESVLSAELTDDTEYKCYGFMWPDDTFGVSIRTELLPGVLLRTNVGSDNYEEGIERILRTRQQINMSLLSSGAASLIGANGRIREDQLFFTDGLSKDYSKKLGFSSKLWRSDALELMNLAFVL